MPEFKATISLDDEVLVSNADVYLEEIITRGVRGWNGSFKTESMNIILEHGIQPHYTFELDDGRKG